MSWNSHLNFYVVVSRLLIRQVVFNCLKYHLAHLQAILCLYFSKKLQEVSLTGIRESVRAREDESWCHRYRHPEGERFTIRTLRMPQNKIGAEICRKRIRLSNPNTHVCISLT